jgi:hypothetical protein
MTENVALRNPVFIFGFPRSGTTLIRSVLGQHSQISLVNEPELIWALRHAGYNIGSIFAKDDLGDLIDQLKEIGLCRKHLERNFATTKPALINPGNELSFREVFELLLPKPEGNRMVWGEKSLNNLFFTKELLRIYPTALLIHIVRDPRSAILSYYQKTRQQKSGGKTNIETDLHAAWLLTVLYFARQARLWQRWVSIARVSEQLVPSENWIEISFEDFLIRPRQCLQWVCEIIGVDFEDGMLKSIGRRKDPVLAGSSAYAHKKLAQELDPSRAGSYQHLPDQLVWTTEKLAGSMMQHFGYRQMLPVLPLTQRLALNIALTVSSWPLRREEKSHLKKRCLAN